MAHDRPAPPVLDPARLAHRYDERQDAILFVDADRATRAAAPFLIDAHLPGAAAPVAVARRDALSALPAPTPLHFIFHSAYCCSTLLAGTLDVAGRVTVLKEPQILNDMVGWRHRGAAPAAVGTVMGDVLRLLARPFEPGEACVVKPSNIVNGLAAAMIELRPEARAILLYAPLRAFVTSVARKGMDGRLWVRELLSRQLAEGMVDLGFAPQDYIRHTDLQAAAVGWLAQQKLFGQLARRYPARVRTLDSEMLVADPLRAVAAVDDFLGLRIGPARRAAAVRDRFARDAKTGAGFAAGQREADRRAGEALHRDEIDKVTAWAEAVARTAGVALAPPAPLLR